MPNSTVQERLRAEYKEQELSGRPPKYPWGEWFNGEVWELVKGEDFDSEPKSFRVHAHRTAKEYGGRVRTKLHGRTGISIVFYEPEHEL